MIYLEIGDWVRVKDPYRKIVNVAAVMRNSVKTIGNTEEISEYGYYEIEPVPLTAEIMTLNGLEAYGEEGVLVAAFEEYGRQVLIVRKRGVRSRYEPRWVHELQHILRLEGLNKEIKL